MKNQCLLVLGVIAVCGPTLHALPPQYVVKDLGALGPAGAFSYAYGINNAGQVVGNSYLSSNNKVGPHAFLYDGSMHDLGTLGGPTSRAAAN